MLRFSLKHKFAAVQKIIGIYRQHENQMQRKHYKTKSDQFSKWYREILSKKIFGNRDLGIIKEWERFFRNLTLVKKERSVSVFLKILSYPNNFNKIKLFIVFFTPGFISKRIIGET